MSEQRIPTMSLLQIEKCVFFDGQRCDFTNAPRPFHIVSYINRGKVIFKSRNNTIPLKEGDVFYIPMGETYISEWSGGDVVYCTSVFFSFDTGRDPTADKSYAIQKIEGKDGELAANLVQSLSANRSKEKFTDFSTLRDFFSLCDLLFGAASSSPKAIDANAVTKALDFIDENYNKAFSVKELADLCNFSESRFYHVFKELVGMAPIEYKHITAVKHAQLYLSSEREYTVEEVSDKCGFSSSIYFRRVFKKITGKTPREYKKTARM